MRTNAGRNRENNKKFEERKKSRRKRDTSGNAEGTGAGVLNTISEIIERIWKEETMPTVWNTRIICPFHKKIGCDST